MTYLGTDGRQYVVSGIGGWSGAIAAAEIDPRVRNGALGFVGATQDLPDYTLGGSTLLVFALPGQETAAAAPDADELIEDLEDIAAETDGAVADARSRRLRRLLPLPTVGLAAIAAARMAAAEPDAPEQRELRVCADPNNLPFSNARGEGLRTSSPSSSGASSAGRSRTPGGRSGAASSATR